MNTKFTNDELEQTLNNNEQNIYIYISRPSFLSIAKLSLVVFRKSLTSREGKTKKEEKIMMKKVSSVNKSKITST